MLLKKGNLETMSVIDYEAFKYYKENAKKRNLSNTGTYVQHGKILSKIYEKIGEKITESPGGVFIENFGYFSGIVDMIKNYTSYFNGNINLNRNTSGYKFFLIFVPIAKDNVLREWVADGSFTEKVRGKFTYALRNKIKFRFSPTYFTVKYKKSKNE